MSSPPLVGILEDDGPSADALSLIISDCGADSVHALTAADVLALASERRLSHLIADFNLGDVPNGVDAARELLAACPDLRVLILTGTFHKRGEVAAAAAGFDMMLKPARAEAIEAWIYAR